MAAASELPDGGLETAMAKENTASWRLDRRVNLSVLLQLMVLASLILGSWVNLQSQLDLLQHDVTMLLQSQKDFQQKLERLSERSLSCEYRLQALERRQDGQDRLGTIHVQPSASDSSRPRTAS
jgi:hypothetical protein